MFGIGLTRVLPESVRSRVINSFNWMHEAIQKLRSGKKRVLIRLVRPGRGAAKGDGSYKPAAGMKPARFASHNLNDFIALVDGAGGPSSPAAAKVWSDFAYERTVVVDDTLDPYGETYWQQQVSLYREISGRELDQENNELVEFDLDQHVHALNPYASIDPARMAVHYARLGKLVKHARLPSRARVLDLGCGWGLTSEFLATIGCRVTAVDINDKFVELVRQRSLRLNYGIETIRSNFDILQLSSRFDMILFYECLHHAVRPWQLIHKVASWLAPGGRIALAGEPIQSLWWRTWGLRLDGLSVYCIRKFGWFENGWSKEFIYDALSRCDLSVDYRDDADPELGPIILASRCPAMTSAVRVGEGGVDHVLC